MRSKRSPEKDGQERHHRKSGGLSDELVLYLSRGSVCCSKVQIVLEEKGLSPELRLINHRAGEAHTPEYLRLNPNGVVPTLLHRGRPIIESTVICEFLEDAYPEQRLSPNNPFDRATMRLWTLRPDAGLHLACAKVTFAIRRNVDFSRQMTVARPRSATSLADVVEFGLSAPGLERHFGLYHQTLETMARQLGLSKWLAGNDFSLADAAMIPYVIRLEHLGLSWMWNETDGNGPVAEWLSNCKARPSFTHVFDAIPAEAGAVVQDHSVIREAVSGLLKSFYG